MGNRRKEFCNARCWMSTFYTVKLPKMWFNCTVDMECGQARSAGPRCRQHLISLGDFVKSCICGQDFFEDHVWHTQCSVARRANMMFARRQTREAQAPCVPGVRGAQFWSKRRPLNLRLRFCAVPPSPLSAHALPSS